MKPLIHGIPNRTSEHGLLPRAIPESFREGERSELKHLSMSRSRKQVVIPLVTASEKGKGQTEPHHEECWGMWCTGHGQVPQR